MHTKEELIAYLEANQDTESPFNETVWQSAVEKTQNKERQFKEIKTTEFDGAEKVLKVPNGSLNPVGKYFQLIALPQYSKPAEVEDEEDFVDDDGVVLFEDEDKEETVSSWINVFFDGYSAADKKFLRERLSDYYDNYELNEGADKVIAVTAVADELEIMNLTKLRAKNKDNEARLEKVKKGYMNSLDSLKALKKQRGAADEGKNKLTLWIDELEKEGQFTIKKDESYTQDDIDKLLEIMESGMRAVYYEG